MNFVLMGKVFTELNEVICLCNLFRIIYVERLAVLEGVCGGLEAALGS